MAKIDFELILLEFLNSPFNRQFDDRLKCALKDMGLEYIPDPEGCTKGSIRKIKSDENGTPPNFEIEAGKWYMCLCNVENEFKKGNLYFARENCMLINENKEDSLWNGSLGMFFRPATEYELSLITSSVSKYDSRINGNAFKTSFRLECGKWYMCLQDLSFDTMSGEVVFIKGTVYLCPSDMLLFGTAGGDFVFNEYMEINKWFRPATPDEILKAKHGITGISSKKAEGKLGEMIAERKAEEEYNPYDDFRKSDTEQETPHEPKFKEGDWVVYQNETFQVVKDAGTLILQGKRYQTYFIEEACRPWTIEDAKDGDVLISKYGSICIFKDNKSCYCYIDTEHENFYAENNRWFSTDYTLKPATKEQRNLLFQKLKEAGYEWDAEKKELKKIIVGKFKSGDTIEFKGYGHKRYTILEVYSDYYVSDKGRMDSSYTDANFELVESESESIRSDQEELTEFEKAVLDIIPDHNTHTDSVEEFARRNGNRLLSIARKQFINEAVDWLQRNINCSIWLFDFRKYMEKGEKL